jgi:hypothetical protein
VRRRGLLGVAAPRNILTAEPEKGGRLTSALSEAQALTIEKLAALTETTLGQDGAEVEIRLLVEELGGSQGVVASLLQRVRTPGANPLEFVARYQVSEDGWHRPVFRKRERHGPWHFRKIKRELYFQEDEALAMLERPGWIGPGFWQDSSDPGGRRSRLGALLGSACRRFLGTLSRTDPSGTPRSEPRTSSARLPGLRSSRWKGEQVKEMNSADLARLLLGRDLVPDDDRPFVDAVRASLRRHKCLRGVGDYRPGTSSTTRWSGS